MRSSIRILLDDIIKRERDEKIKKEKEKLVPKDSYYDKNNFENVFFRMVKIKKIRRKKNKQLKKKIMKIQAFLKINRTLIP